MSENLATYIDRSKETIDSFPRLSERDVEMKFIQPLLDLLGWDRYTDVRSQYSVRAGTTNLKVDYALFIDDVPEVIVEAKSGNHNLTEDDREQLRSYMRQTETDWGMLTNGKNFQILSSTNSTTRPLVETSIQELDSEWDNMEILSKEMIQSGESYELEKQLDSRKKAIDRLSENKESIKDDIEDDIIGKTNDSIAPDIEEEVDQFIENLIQDLSTDPGKSELPRTTDDVLELLGTHLPGRSEEVREKRAAHLLTAYDFLQSEVKTTGESIRTHLVENSSNEITEEGVERDWVNYLRDNLSELPRIIEPAGGASQIWIHLSPELKQEIVVDEIDDWIKDLNDVPVGPEESVKLQQSIIQQAYDYIVDEKSISKDDIIATLPEYTAHYQNFDGFWSYCIREALQTKEDIESPADGNKEWRYIGEMELPENLNLTVEDWVKDQQIPGGKMTQKEREAILQYSYNYLREVGEGQRADFKRYLSKNIPQEMGGYNKFSGLWSYLLKDGLKAAPGVEVHNAGKGGPITFKYSNGK